MEVPPTLRVLIGQEPRISGANVQNIVLGLFMADDTKKRVSIGTFISQVRTEGSKIAWPTWPDTLRTAIMVMIMATILGLFFFGVDSFFGFIVRKLIELL